MVTVRTLARLATALVASTYVLLVFGASVRVHGAGLACPDWPLCFGEVIPTLNFEVGLEWGHRVLAGLISLGFLGLIAGMWAARERVGRGLLGLGLFGAVALLVQVILGGLTVLELLAEWTVTSHLLTGNTFCLVLLLLAMGLWERERPVERLPVRWADRGVAVALAVVVPIQLALGGLVSSSHAGLVCGTWPACNGDVWFPTFSGLVGLQVMHRIVAYGLFGVAVAAAVVVRSGRPSRAARVVFALVCLQVLLGVANVLMYLPVEVTLAHTAGAAAIVLATTWLNHEVWSAPVAAQAVDPVLSAGAGVAQ
jgi:cytochrome c oxidase assembly protein subunit 15